MIDGDWREHRIFRVNTCEISCMRDDNARHMSMHRLEERQHVQLDRVATYVDDYSEMRIQSLLLLLLLQRKHCVNVWHERAERLRLAHEWMMEKFSRCWSLTRIWLNDCD